MNHFVYLFLIILTTTSCSKNAFDVPEYIEHIENGENGENGECEETKITFERSNINIILIMGQSNTHLGLGLNKTIDTTSAGVMQLGRFGNKNHKIINATEPLQHHSYQHNKIGFGLTFANLFKNELLSKNDSVIIIPCGSSGSSFIGGKWNKGNSLYNDAVERINFIRDNYPNSKLQAILWHQGESDIISKSYKKSLTNFINDIREDVGNNQVPFILGGMVPYWISQSQGRQEKQEIIAGIKNTLCIIGYADPNIPFVIEKENNAVDEIHFNAEGQRELGRRYFKEYLKLINVE